MEGYHGFDDLIFQPSQLTPHFNPVALTTPSTSCFIAIFYDLPTHYILFNKLNSLGMRGVILISFTPLFWLQDQLSCVRQVIILNLNPSPVQIQDTLFETDHIGGFVKLPLLHSTILKIMW